MPPASLTLMSHHRRLSLVTGARLIFALILTSVFAALPAVADQTATNLTLYPQISWQFLQPDHIDNSDTLIARYDPMDFPFAGDSPFHDREFQLAQRESVFVTLPARHWFYLSYARDGQQESAQRGLTGWLSSAPGLAQKKTWPAQQNILPPASRHRIIEISNPQQDDIAFYLATGTSIDNQTFAPLSSLGEDSAATTRFYASDNRDMDYLDTHQILEFELEKDKTYWLEGIQVTGEPWSQNQSQLWTWQENKDEEEEEDGDSQDGKSDDTEQQFLFARESRKQLMTQEGVFSDLYSAHREEDAPAQHLNVMRSSLYKADKNMNTRLELDKQGYVRLQSTDEDWLFAKNYETYSSPAVEQKLQQHAFSQALHQQVSGSMPGANKPQTIEPQTSKPQKITAQSQAITDSATAATLNNWLAWQSLSPQANRGIRQQPLITKNLNWDFAEQSPVDLSQDNISLPDFNEKQLFNELPSGKGLVWFRPDDAVTNQLQLQIVGQSASDHSTKPEQSGSYIVKVDGNVFAEFVPFNPPELQDFVQDPHWHIVTASEHTNPDVQAYNKAVATGSQVLNLPVHWNKLEIVAKDTPALVRVRYRKPRYPKLDAPQWHTWLTFNNRFEQVEKTLANHPHWLYFLGYLQVKQKQFRAEDPSQFWHTLISTGQPPQALFDLDFPQGMDDYQRLQANLLAPRVNQWQYWQQLLADLRGAGWSGYADDLSITLVRYHPHEIIVEQAIADYFYQLSLSNNYSQQVSLLSYGSFSEKLSVASQNKMRLSLAELLQQQNRHDFALFVLGFAQNSQARNQLIYEAALHEGYLTLAEAFKPQTPTAMAQDQAATVNNPRSKKPQAPQQLSLTSVSHISAAKRIQLYNGELNVRQSNLLLNPESPLVLTVSGPTELEFEARQWFAHNIPDSTTDNDWLTLTYAGREQLIPLYYSDYRSTGLQHRDATVGAAHRFKVQLPNAGTLTIHSGHSDVSVNMKEVSSNLRNQVTRAHCYRENTWLTQDYYSWSGSRQQQAEKARQDQQNSQQNPADDGSQYNCSFNTYFDPIHSNTDGASDTSQITTFSAVEASRDLLPKNRGAYQDFLQRLKDFESAPDNSTLTILNRILHGWPHSSLKHRLLQRVNRNAVWQAQNNPVLVKKFSAYEANTNAPLTPAGYRGRLLYTPFKPEWEKLSESSALNYELAISENQQYQLKLLSQHHLFNKQNSVEVEVAINDKLHEVLTLTMGQETALALPFSPGTQNLSVRLKNIQGQVSVLAQLQYQDALSAGNSTWKNQPQTVRLKLFQAEQQQPLQQFFPEPSWLRIDSFTDKGISKQEFLLAEKGLFNWYPNARPQEQSDEKTLGQKRLGHRMYRLQLLPNAGLAATNGASPTGTAKKAEQPAFNLYPSGDVHGSSSIDSNAENFPDFALLPHPPNPENQHLVSRPWGMELGLEQRRTPVEDAAQNNRFWQMRLYSQSADAQRRFYSRYELAARLYSSELSQSIHGSYQWWDTAWWRNWDLNVGLRFAAQEGFGDEGLAWSGRLHAQALKEYRLNRRWFNRFSVSVWGNLINSGKDTEQFATAVYSQYKLDHRYGVQLSDTIRYKWHHDFESWAQFTLNSNPLTHSDLVDNGIVVLGSRVFYQGLAADIRWRYQSFMTDRNRINKSRDSRLSLALDWFGWEEDAHYRFRLGYDRNLSADENYWFLRFSWNESGARGVQDYMPQSLAFAGLRQQQFTNEIMQSATEEYQTPENNSHLREVLEHEGEH